MRLGGCCCGSRLVGAVLRMVAGWPPALDAAFVSEVGPTLEAEDSHERSLLGLIVGIQNCRMSALSSSQQGVANSVNHVLLRENRIMIHLGREEALLAVCDSHSY